MALFGIRLGKSPFQPKNAVVGFTAREGVPESGISTGVENKPTGPTQRMGPPLRLFLSPNQGYAVTARRLANTTLPAIRIIITITMRPHCETVGTGPGGADGM